MARKHQLRKQRAGTVINLTSKQQEGRLGCALTAVEKRLRTELGVELYHEREWKLADIVRRLREDFPNVRFHCYSERSSMRPDGGILSIRDKSEKLFPVLIVEVKNQGTNDLREAEGKPRQPKGNVIERLGKNVIGFRTAMLNEGIIPFVCFGDGCDFAASSSILDRVVTIGMFGPLNCVQVVNDEDRGQFNRGSFYFRPEPWTAKEMESVMFDIAERSIHHYYAKYGKANFPGTK